MSKSNYYIQDNSDIETKKLEAARGLYQNGNYTGALKLYLDMINTSYSYRLYYEIGRCYYKLNDIDNAESYLTRSIALESYKNPSYTFLGNVYYKKQDIEKAIENWVIAFSFKPEDESVCLNLATSYFAKEMRFQSLYYYEKYLKYAKDKKSSYYLEIKKSIDEFSKMGKEFYQKALRAVSMHDNKTAIQALEYAVKNYPLSFDINFLLGKLFFEEKEYMKSMIYLKQAFCLDKKSLDVLQLLSSTLINLGDFTGAYCCLKRILPLVINNQREYLEVIKTIKQLEDSFDSLSSKGHEEWAIKYYKDNNYHFALLEYENWLIVNPQENTDLTTKIDQLKSYISPENKIIKFCLEKGGVFYSAGDFRQANKYFSKVMLLSTEDSSEYKIAKSRVINV